MAKQSAKQEGADLSFEEAMAQIEEIIARIESGDIGLETSIDEYEKGIALIARCREILGRAEQRVDDLTDRMHEQAD